MMRAARRSFKKALYIVGTDTEVGKTTVTCSLARILRKRRLNVGVMKPISSGTRADSEALKLAAGVEDKLDLINPFHLKYPMAPGVSCRIEKRGIDFERIREILLEFCRRYDIILCESAGGVETPITSDLKTNADLIHYLNVPTLIVARAGLGTINHTLMTVGVLRRKGVEIKGIILNGTKRGDIVERTNPEVIREMSSLPVLSVLPFTNNKKTLDKKLKFVRI